MELVGAVSGNGANQSVESLVEGWHEECVLQPLKAAGRLRAGTKSSHLPQGWWCREEAGSGEQA